VPASYGEYLKWFHGRSAQQCATFAPTQQRVDVGDYGWFDSDLLFHSAADQNVATRLNMRVRVSADSPIGDAMYVDSEDFRFALDTGAGAPIPLHPPVMLQAGAKVHIEATKDHWYILQVLKATKAEMSNPAEVQEQIRQLYLAGQWSLDDYVVTERVRCQSGFAVLGEASGKGIEVALDTDVRLLDGRDLIKAHLAPAYRNGGQSCDTYTFDEAVELAQCPTPSFAAPMGISRKLWARLLGLRRMGNVLHDAAGREWPVTKTPINLQHLTESNRRYQQGDGVPTPSEVSNIPLADFFETLDGLEQIDMSELSFSLDASIGDVRAEVETVSYETGELEAT
jgi:hypothetical protein